MVKIPTFEPITTADEDRLGYENASKKLAKMIDSTETPNTLGIYGVWGSGKTSLMNLIKIQLDKDSQYNQRISTVWFDVWKYEYEKDMPITYPLLHQIEKTLKSKNLKSFFVKNAKFFSALSLNLISLGASTYLGNDLKSLSDNIDESMKIIYSKYENWVDNIDDFKSEYEAKISDSLRNNKKEKLVVFIDDMDRCLQENVLNLLEIMKNFLSVKNTLFVIGVDKRVLVDHINQKYPSLNRQYGEEYLNKIIPVSFNLPSKNPIEVVKLHLSSMTENKLDDQEIEIIGSYLELFCGANRRLVNIIIHKFLLALSYIDIDKLLAEIRSETRNIFTTVPQCRIAIFRWCILQELRPNLFVNFNWSEEYDEHVTGTNMRDKIIYRIHHPLSLQSGPNNPLTPRIDREAAFILENYITDGLFK